MDRWLRSFAAAIAADDLLEGVRRLVVAVSGGPDSVCLLELFHEWVREVDTSVDILVGHVHHGIRGKEADRDAAFVERLAGQKGLAFLCARGDAPALAEQAGVSLEVAARRLRYGTFRAWAHDHDVDGVALGHHFDDQAETIVLRAIRGSGLPGLSGIPRRRTLQAEDPAGRHRGRHVTIVRPLLDWRRRDILSFLDARGLSARQDSTNADPGIPRNRVRREILPALERAQPGAAVSLVRLGELARRVRKDLRELARRALSESQRAVGPRRIVLDAAALASWPESVLREVIALAKRRAMPGAQARSEVDTAEPREPPYDGSALALRPFENFVRSLREWLRDEGRGARVIELGSGVEAALRYGRVSVYARTSIDGVECGKGSPAVLRPAAAPDVAARVRWGDWRFSFSWRSVRSAAAMAIVPGETSRGPSALEAEEASVERFDLDVLESYGPLRLRSRRSGDMFHPLGAPGRKKLKEFFRECEVEPRERDRVPLLASGETIQWVVGCRIGHVARCRPETRRVLEVRATRNPESQVPKNDQ